MLEQKERLDRRLSGGESTRGEDKAGKVGSNDETKPSFPERHLCTSSRLG